MTVEEFIGNSTRYNSTSGTVVGTTKTGPQPIVDIRGWGRIQYLFKYDGVFDYEKAAAFQDEVGEWIADAINQKLKQIAPR